MADYNAIAVTDLDGTLLDHGHRLTANNRQALERLHELGVMRVVATGRSPFSAYKVIDRHFPIDYLVCSSGAAILSWPDGHLVRAVDLPAARAIEVAKRLEALELDFMLHREVPDNHYFWYHRAGSGNADFEARLARYAGHARPWSGAMRDTQRFSQLLVVEPAQRRSSLNRLRDELKDLHVIRATSPLDLRSRWLEVFPAKVSKASAAAWLQDRHGIERRPCLVIGNDYNDEALLEWGASPYVVANAPAELLRAYPAVPSNDESGFAHAVQDWLTKFAGRFEDASTSACKP